MTDKKIFILDWDDTINFSAHLSSNYFCPELWNHVFTLLEQNSYRGAQIAIASHTPFELIFSALQEKFFRLSDKEQDAFPRLSHILHSNMPAPIVYDNEYAAQKISFHHAQMNFSIYHDVKKDRAFVVQNILQDQLEACEIFIADDSDENLVKINAVLENIPHHLFRVCLDEDQHPLSFNYLYCMLKYKDFSKKQRQAIDNINQKYIKLTQHYITAIEVLENNIEEEKKPLQNRKILTNEQINRIEKKLDEITTLHRFQSKTHATRIATMHKELTDIVKEHQANQKSGLLRKSLQNVSAMIENIQDNKTYQKQRTQYLTQLNTLTKRIDALKKNIQDCYFLDEHALLKYQHTLEEILNEIKFIQHQSCYGQSQTLPKLATKLLEAVALLQRKLLTFERQALGPTLSESFCLEENALKPQSDTQKETSEHSAPSLIAANFAPILTCTSLTAPNLVAQGDELRPHPASSIAKTKIKALIFATDPLRSFSEPFITTAKKESLSDSNKNKMEQPKSESKSKSKSKSKLKLKTK